MNLLTLETSCDETAAAVIDDAMCVRGAVVASQHDLHQRYSGVVPEIASRAHLQRVIPVIDATLRQANMTLADIDAVAVVTTPGLAGSLLVGLCAAKAICVATGKPLVAINHLHAHIYACRMSAGVDIFPCVGLIVSGGHTSLYRCRGPLEFDLIGGTIDDAAGEAFDKVASLLGLSYPGGPSIETAAQAGNGRAFPFPRAFQHEPERIQFSFSGLKTAVRYQMARLIESEQPTSGRVDQSLAPDPSRLSSQQIADLAASFQEAVVDILTLKTVAAVQQESWSTLCVGGGVAANRLLRERLTSAGQAAGARVMIAPPALCTDNAVMGAIAWERLRGGLTEKLDLEITPGLIRAHA